MGYCGDNLVKLLLLLVLVLDLKMGIHVIGAGVDHRVGRRRDI
jgi:hypothetical protein